MLPITLTALSREDYQAVPGAFFRFAESKLPSATASLIFRSSFGSVLGVLDRVSSTALSSCRSRSLAILLVPLLHLLLGLRHRCPQFWRGKLCHSLILLAFSTSLANCIHFGIVPCHQGSSELGIRMFVLLLPSIILAVLHGLLDLGFELSAMLPTCLLLSFGDCQAILGVEPAMQQFLQVGYISFRETDRARSVLVVRAGHHPLRTKSPSSAGNPHAPRHCASRELHFGLADPRRRQSPCYRALPALWLPHDLRAGHGP